MSPAGDYKSQYQNYKSQYQNLDYVKIPGCASATTYTSLQTPLLQSQILSQDLQNTKKTT